MRLLKQVTAIVAVLILWHFMALRTGRQMILPSPIEVGRAVTEVAASDLPRHLAISFGRVMLGWTIAAALGIPTGFLLGLSSRARSLLQPTVEVLRPIPAIAWLPIFLLVFGIGTTLATSVVFYAAFFPILLNSALGVRGVDRVLELAARTLGANRGDIFRHVVIPGSLESVVTGLRLGMTFGWMSLVAAELIGARDGIGSQIMFYQRTFQSAHVIAYMAIIAALGFSLDKMMLMLNRWFTPWRTGERIGE